MTLPDPELTIRQLGNEGEPLVIVDGYSGMADELLAAGRAARFGPDGTPYPGIRAPLNPAYLDRRRQLLEAIMQTAFGIARGVKLDRASYSLVTLTQGELAPGQRIPHYDDASGTIIAIMHYLLGPQSGGTSFYRHRRTGFEAITPEREAAFAAALAEDEREFGPAPQRYFYGNSQAYDLIDEVEARPDRMIFYRGRQLHSGVIPDPAALSDDPARGRLTINMFLRGW